MAIDTSVRRTRRALLAGGIGGLVTLAASALGRVDPVLAGSDGDVVLGAPNSTTVPTTITNYGTGTGATAITGQSADGTGVYGRTTTGAVGAVVGRNENHRTGVFGFSSGLSDSWPLVPAKTGVYGYAAQDATASGVWGMSTSGRGVYGSTSLGGVGVYGKSVGGTGIVGNSDTYIGVYANSGAVVGPAMAARAGGNSTGVLGYSGSGAVPVASAKTGVYGYAAQDATAIGVRGVSPAGRGVQGEATSGFGVRGAATSGYGAYVTSTSGTAVYAAATTSGYALRTSGRVKVEKASGVATILGTKTSVVVTPGLDVTMSSFVLLTPKGSLGGRNLWYTTDATANTFTIRVSSALTVNLAVGWLLLG
jgi:hypothetical protein